MKTTKQTEPVRLNISHYDVVALALIGGLPMTQYIATEAFGCTRLAKVVHDIRSGKYGDGYKRTPDNPLDPSRFLRTFDIQNNGGTVDVGGAVFERPRTRFAVYQMTRHDGERLATTRADGSPVSYPVVIATPYSVSVPSLAYLRSFNFAIGRDGATLDEWSVLASNLWKWTVRQWGLACVPPSLLSTVHTAIQEHNERQRVGLVNLVRHLDSLTTKVDNLKDKADNLYPPTHKGFGCIIPKPDEKGGQ